MTRADTAGLTTEVWADAEVCGLPVRMTATLGDETVFTVRLGDLSFGDMLQYLVGLARPGEVFELEPPWDLLSRINLQSFTFAYNPTKGRIGFSYDEIDADLGFMRVDRLAVWYQLAGGAGTTANKSRLDVQLFGMFLGQDYTKQPLSWDVLTQRPPEPPAAGPKYFELDYAGFGQHVTLRDATQTKTLTSVIDALVESYEPVEQPGDPMSSLPALKYDAGVGWLIGTRFSVLDTVTLGVLFNDPEMYGLHLELKGERAKKLAGLSFDILYRRIADGLGVYHVEFALPSAFRQIELGAASLTLPMLVVDIYTNGNFRVDLGFPYGLDFSRSFTLQFFAGPIPMVGAGGFYFGVLDGQTSTDVPRISNGTFSPVIVLGVGLQVGVGKTFDKGILRAGILISVEGALEGVLGFFHPADPGVARDTYYRVSGIVAVTGHVFGSVDFGIISAGVDLWARVSAQIVLESYAATEVVLEATVSVSVSVKIVFFTVHFGFSATVRESVTLGNASAAPWRALTGEDARRGRFLDARDPRRLWRARPQRAALLDAARTDRLPWRALRVAPVPPTIRLYYQTIISAGPEGDHPGGDGGGSLVVKLCASLFIPVARTASFAPDDAAFTDVVRIAFDWALRTLHSLPGAAGLDTDEVFREDVQAIYDDLLKDPRQPVDLCTIAGFLCENFEFFIAPYPADAEPGLELTVFPMLPFLTLKADGHEANFAREAPCSPAYRAAVADYYAQLRLDASQSEPTAVKRRESVDTYSMAAFLLADYFSVILRGIVQSALDQFAGLVVNAASPEPITLPMLVAKYCPTLSDAEARIVWANATSPTFLAAGAQLWVGWARARVDEDATFAELAAKLGLTPETFTARLKSSEMLRAGATLQLPRVRYLLPAGETLGTVLDYFGVTLASLRAENPDFDLDSPAGLAAILPGGRLLTIPPHTHVVQPKDSLEAIAEHYFAPPLALVVDNYDAAGILAADADVVSGLWGQVRQVAVQRDGTSVMVSETLEAIAARACAGGADAVRLALEACDQAGLLAVGAAITIPSGTYRLRASDTLDGVAARFGVEIAALMDTNPGFDWAPDPNSGDLLPGGRRIRLPADFASVIQPGDTLRALAERFGYAVGEFVALQEIRASETLLAAGADILVPAFRYTVQSVEGGQETLLAIAQRFSLSAQDLGLLNVDAQFSMVTIPDVERMPRAELESELDAAGAFRAPAQAVAQFLMSGLRLPDPSHFPAPDGADDPQLFPLYALSGQQWAVSASPPIDYSIQIERNGEDLGCGCKPPVIAFPDSLRGMTVKLRQQEVDLIAAFAQIISGTPLPESLARSALPQFVQLPLRFGLGKPVPWAASEAIVFDDSGAGAPELYALPEALLREVARTPERSPRLVLVADTGRGPEGTPASQAPISACGWATRVQMVVRRVPDPDRPGELLPDVYEVFSTDQQGRDLLLSLLEFLWAPPPAEGPLHTEIYLEYANDPTNGDLTGVRSDAIDRSRIRLARASLSTETRSPGAFGRARLRAAPSTLATLLPADSVGFLELLWQASVTNAGGYYLYYRSAGEEGGGLPDGLFDETGAGRLGVVVLARPPGGLATIPIQPFHNCVVTAHALDSTRTGLFVEPPSFLVSGSETSFDRLGDADPLSVAMANATVADLFAPGVQVGNYTLQPGDTLLAGALAAGIPFEAAIEQILSKPLRASARIWLRLDWMVRRGTLAPGQAGFRLRRANPEHEPDAAKQQFQQLFSRLGYFIAEGAGFRQSPQGLPASPSAAEKLPPETPWTYSRVLPVDRFVGASPLPPVEVNPFAAIGRELTLRFEMHDVLGNTCPLPEASAKLESTALYTDPIRGADHWPGTVVGYDLVDPKPEELAVDPNATTMLQLGAGFDSGRYASGPAESFERARGRAISDLETYRFTVFQLAQPGLRFTVRTSFTTGREELKGAELLEYLRSVQEYLATISGMRAVTHTVTDGQALHDVAGDYQVSTAELGVANAASAQLLAQGAQLAVPRFYVTIVNDSLELVGERDPRSASPRDLGEYNADVELQAGTEIEVGDTAYTIRAGDTLRRIAKRHGDGSPGDLATENVAVANLFQPGTPLLVEVRTHAVEAGDTLTSVAAECACTLEDLVLLNGDSAVLAAGAALEVPLHAQLGAEGSCVYRVGRGATLAKIAGETRRSVPALGRANQNVDGLLLEGAELAVGEARETVRPRDTLGTILERFRHQPGLTQLGAAELALENADRAGLLREGALMLVTPLPFEVKWAVAKSFDGLTIPFDVTMSVERERDFDPLMQFAPGVAATTTQLRPFDADAAKDGTQTFDLPCFARRVHHTFPALVLGTSSGVSPEQASRTLTAIHLDSGAYDFALIDTPFFFAPAPLSVTLWSSTPGSGGAAERLATGIDLDVWGRRFLADLDRLLSAGNALAIAGIAPAHYADLVEAKQGLAAAISRNLRLVVEPDSLVVPDEAAAREVLRQQLLVRLSAAYTSDVVVQYRVTVKSTFTDPRLAPRLSGRVVGTVYELPEDVTLGELADAEHLDAPLDHLAGYIAEVGGILTPGKTVSFKKKKHEILPDDTLATVAQALQASVSELAGAIRNVRGVLRGGADLGVVRRSTPIGPDDTFESLIAYLQPGLARAGDIAAAADAFLGMNATVPGILRAGELSIATRVIDPGDSLDSIAKRLQVKSGQLVITNRAIPNLLRPDVVIEDKVTVGLGMTFEELAALLELSLADLAKLLGPRTDVLAPGNAMLRVTPVEGTVSPGQDLTAVAKALRIEPRELVEALLSRAGILTQGVEVAALVRQPGFTSSGTKVALTQDSPEQKPTSSLTFVVDVDSAGALESLSARLRYVIQELEYDVHDVPGVEGYQASSWLSLVEPIVDETLKRVEIPIPLRAYPTPPSMLAQSVVADEVPRASQPPIADLRRFAYHYRYAYVRAAQDDLFTGVDVNVDTTAGVGEALSGDELPYRLAEYIEQADALNATLAGLSHFADAEPGQVPQAVIDAIDKMVQHAAAISAAWATWSPPPPPPLPVRQARVLAAVGRGRTAVATNSGVEAPRLRASRRLLAPRRGRRAAAALATSGPLTESGADIGMDAEYEHELPNQDVLCTQNCQGVVRVTRNAELLTDRRTTDAFVYHVSRRTTGAIVPLLARTGAYDLAKWQSGPADLGTRLRRFFSELLDLDVSSPVTLDRRISVAVNYALPIVDGADPRDAATLLSCIPVLLAPAFTFTKADLDPASGFCENLTIALTRWLTENQPVKTGAAWQLQVNVYSTLPETSGAQDLPVLSLTDLRLALDDITDSS